MLKKVYFSSNNNVAKRANIIAQFIDYDYGTGIAGGIDRHVAGGIN